MFVRPRPPLSSDRFHYGNCGIFSICSICSHQKLLLESRVQLNKLPCNFLHESSVHTTTSCFLPASLLTKNRMSIAFSRCLSKIPNAAVHSRKKKLWWVKLQKNTPQHLSIRLKLSTAHTYSSTSP